MRSCVMAEQCGETAAGSCRRQTHGMSSVVRPTFRLSGRQDAQVWAANGVFARRSAKCSVGCMGQMSRASASVAGPLIPKRPRPGRLGPEQTCGWRQIAARQQWLCSMAASLGLTLTDRVCPTWHASSRHLLRLPGLASPARIASCCSSRGMPGACWVPNTGIVRAMATSYHRFAGCGPRVRCCNVQLAGEVHARLFAL